MLGWPYYFPSSRTSDLFYVLCPSISPGLFLEIVLLLKESLAFQWLLFDLTSICAGIWTNMIAFVCGFGIVNFYAGKMKVILISIIFKLF